MVQAEEMDCHLNWQQKNRNSEKRMATYRKVPTQVNFLDDDILHCLLWVLSFYQSWAYINRSHRHECENWDWGRTIPRKGIHRWDFHCSVLGVRGYNLTLPSDLLLRWFWRRFLLKKLPLFCSTTVCSFFAALNCWVAISSALKTHINIKHKRVIIKRNFSHI